MPRASKSLSLLFVFTVAMAYVEATVVVHLRALYYPENPLALFPLRLLSRTDLVIEVARETATLIMILCVAWLAEKGFLRVFAAFLFVFGLWDIFYYLWLKVTLDWPTSWREWDVLFLIPWPWFAPWLTPLAVALLFAFWGAWALTTDARPRFTLVSGTLFVTGALLTLVAYLQPGFSLLTEGVEGFRHYRPATFEWVVFIPGYLLMLTGLIQAMRARAAVYR